ncbi:MAG: septum formation initiator family protein [Parcubacteria group bacterium]|nr:septum formation initiator family protein [Parcubacteria group bacterium]
MFPFRILIIPSLILIILLSAAAVRQVMKVQAINREVEILDKEIAKVEAANSSLSENLNYYKTLNFLEKEGRLRMGLKKEGEQIAVFLNSQDNNSSSAEDGAGLNEADSSANIIKWFHYFFVK